MWGGGIIAYYAVIDTNVLVSALLSSHDDLATVQVIHRLYNGDFIPLFSEDILREYNQVLRRKKFHFSEETVCMLVETITDCGEYIVPTPTGECFFDKTDLPFYDVVMERQNDNAHLVTGNLKHFPDKPFIVTPREFLDIFSKKEYPKGGMSQGAGNAV